MLADALRFDPAGYDSTDGSVAACSCTVRVQPNGVWSVFGGSGDIVTGSPTAEAWGNPFPTINDLDFQVQYVVSNQVNSPTIVNGASSYTSINGNIDITVSTSSTSTVRSADITVNIRRTGTTEPVLTQTFNVSVQGTGGGVGGVGGVGVIIP